MSFDLKKLTHALAVARHGSFSLAAEELGLTQPSLSRSIAGLEDLWGVRLFERDRTGVVATRLGADMLREAAQLVAGAKTLDHNMKLRADARAGSLAFGMSGLVGTIFMPGVLTYLATTSPDLNVSAKTESLHDLVSSMHDERIEFAVFSDVEPPPDPDLAFAVIGSLPITFIVRAGHPLAARDDANWADIAAYPLLCSTPTRAPVLPRAPTLICDNYGVAKEVMLRSEAVWFASPLAARAELEEHRACELSVRDDQSSTTSLIWIATRKDRLYSPAAKAVIDHLRRLLPSPAPSPVDEPGA